MNQDKGDKKEPLKLKAEEGSYLLDEISGDERAVGVFFSPTGGNVHYVAKRIKQLLTERPTELHSIGTSPAKEMLSYKNIIIISATLGSETWDGVSDDKWARFLPRLRKLDLRGKNVALVGLGDAVKYPENFVDGMKLLADTVRACGANLVGRTETDGYTFRSTLAIEDNLFLGLPIDQDNEPNKTDERLKVWLSLLQFAND
ncbi:MAG: flavodoxin domain-containing protein [Marinifilaceae bacterium]